MSLDAAIAQPQPAAFIEMEAPALLTRTRGFARRMFARSVQAYVDHRVRRTLAAEQAGPEALAREVARWRAQRTWLESASLPAGSVPAIQVRSPREALKAPPVVSDWFAPVRGEPQGFVFYVHGGSFMFDRSPALSELVMRFAARANARVFAPNYRLAPEHPCPAAVDDIVAALRWFRDAFPDEPLVALAESAGCAILLAAMQQLRRTGEALPSGAVLLSPWVDLSLQSWSIIATTLAGATGGTMAALAMMAHLYLDGRAATDPLASPLFGEFESFPPTLIHASRGDLLYDDAARLADRMRAAGVDLTVRLWREDAHVFEKSAGPKARQSIELAGDFIRHRLAA